MPETLQQFMWYVGIGVIIALSGTTSFFFVRLISGLDSFKVEVSKALTSISDNMNRIHGDLDSRVKIIEVAGCVGHRRRRKEDPNAIDEG